MQLPRVRISLRMIMVAIALIALNLHAAIETRKWHPLPRPFLRNSIGEHGGYSIYRRDFVAFGEYQDSLDDAVPTRIVYYAPRPTILGAWSPVIVSGSLTLMVAAVILGPRKKSDRPASWLARAWGMQFTLAVRATRGLALVVGVIGLNLVGAMATLVNRPPALGPLTPDPRGGGRYVQYKLDGTVDCLLENFGAPLPAVCHDGGWCVQFNFDGITEYILKEHGTGFRRTIETIWRRPPRPGLLEVCIPIIASAAISILVIFAATRAKSAPKPLVGRNAIPSHGKTELVAEPCKAV